MLLHSVISPLSPAIAMEMLGATEQSRETFWMGIKRNQRPPLPRESCHPSDATVAATIIAAVDSAHTVIEHHAAPATGGQALVLQSGCCGSPVLQLTTTPHCDVT